MADEIVDGKRTLIERDGQEFELPRGQSAKLTLGLSALSEGSTFGVRTIEIRNDAIVLHVGENVADHGVGYTFPTG